MIREKHNQHRQRQQRQPDTPYAINNNNKNKDADADKAELFLDQKLDLITAGSKPYLKEHLLTKISRENCSVIVNYMLALQTETTVSDNYRFDTIHKLKLLAEFHAPKTYRDMTRQDILDFLDRLRKPEHEDPLHRWIGSYELNRIVLLRFFKWLYYPDISPSKKRPIPAVMQNIPQIPRKEISCYRPTDLWTEEDDTIFLKYCPSVRDRCWHTVSRDTGCRPIELLRLKIKDVVIQQLDGGYQIAKITVNGKRGVRNVRLNNSYPYLKEWLSFGHPFPSYLNTALFCGVSKKNTGKRIGLDAIESVYERYKKRYFPKLLDDPSVPEEDKLKIRDLLRKPWNPYIRRHTAATEVSKKLKDSVLVDQYMGWSHRGNTRQKYQHYYSDDGIDAMLLADGLQIAAIAKDATKKKGLLKPRICSNCSESNKADSKFCVKCKFVLSYDGYEEVTKEAEETRKALADVEERQRRFEEQILANLEKYQKTLLDMVAPHLENIKDERERNQEKIKWLIEGPTTFGLIDQSYLVGDDNNNDNEEGEEEAQ